MAGAKDMEIFEESQLVSVNQNYLPKKKRQDNEPMKVFCRKKYPAIF